MRIDPAAFHSAATYNVCIAIQILQMRLDHPFVYAGGKSRMTCHDLNSIGTDLAKVVALIDRITGDHAKRTGFLQLLRQITLTIWRTLPTASCAST